MKVRPEAFGGIVAGDDPPFLAFVDRQMMKDIGVASSPLWKPGAEQMGLLSAPTEVHLAATNRCPNTCPHCYMSSGKADPDEMDTPTFKRALKALADMGVFHVALGGGEALARKDIFELADYCREVGIVPNLTTSGVGMTKERATRMPVFGQVNLSLDGIGDLSGVFRGISNFEQVRKAAVLLVEAGVTTGINTVVGRRNFDGLEPLFQFAAEHSLSEIELLRYKPAGRGTEHFIEEQTTHEQNIELWPLVTGLGETYQVTTKIDCSFVPMICYHNPPLEELEANGTFGCEAGNVLMAGRSNGQMAACSFLPSQPQTVFDLKKTWNEPVPYTALRSWRDRAPEPCNSCAYLKLCNGGCHAVSAFVEGNLHAPDPACPKVVEYRREASAVETE